MQPSNQNQNDTLAFSNVEVTDYKIANNPAAFQILSSGLYSNKIEAVIRELSCNAWDAHVSAGKRKTPIHVTLPTPENRWFIVRDEGLGLDHEEVQKLYTTYFESDKRDSNKTVGGFGLGAKSPFAYNDTFTVTAWKNGVERIYTCTMPLGEEPRLIRLVEQPTTHENGVEVKVPVKNEDIDAFYANAVIVFAFFPVKPNINKDIDLLEDVVYKKTPQYVIGRTQPKMNISSSHGWNFSRELGHSRMLRGNTYVVMGTVCYPLDLKTLALSSDEQQFLSSMRLRLNMPIGSISIAASREALQYDPNSRTVLEQTLKNMIDDLMLDLHTTVAAQTTVWEKKCAALKWFSQIILCGSNRTIGHAHQSLTKRDESFFTLLKDYAARKNPTINMWELLHATQLEVPTTCHSTNTIRAYFHLHGEVGRKEVEHGRVSFRSSAMRAALYLNEHSCIVHVDVDGMHDALKQWRQARNNPTVLVIAASKKAQRQEALALCQTFSAAMGDAPIKTLSQIAKEVSWTVAQKTVVKNDFVEIEDRMVTVHMLDRTESEMALKDVPASCRYVLMRNTRARVSDSEHVLSYQQYESVFLKNEQESVRGWHSRESINTVCAMYKYAHEQGVAWSGPEGYILLNPVEYQRLKLNDNAYPFIMPALLDALHTNDALKERMSHAWTKMEMPSSSYYSHASIFTVLASQWRQHWSGTEKKRVRQAWANTPWETWFEDTVAPQTQAQNHWTGSYGYLRNAAQTLSHPFNVAFHDEREAFKEWQQKTYIGNAISWEHVKDADQFAETLSWVLSHSTAGPSM